MPNPSPRTDVSKRQPGDWFRRPNPFSTLRDEIDEVFNHYFFPEARNEGSNGALAMSANLDVSETKNAISVVLDVPGIDQKDIDISLKDGALEISGHREEEAEEKDADFHRVERSYGAFRRRIALPCEVEGEKVQAKLKKGVLKIKLPKSAKAKSNGRKIEISAS